MICVPILARNNAEALKKMVEAARLADVMEIRLDLMESFDINEILQSATKPVIVTYRSKREGGSGSAHHETRVRHLSRAIELGADFVDVEYSLPLEFRHRLFQVFGSSRLILSTHLSNMTPSRENLEELFRKMAATGADIVKIVTHAREPSDNLSVLALIPLARKLGIKIIAFSMGPVGRMSRIFTLHMGGYLTFASLGTGEESASGQIPVREMKRILEILS